MPMTTYKVWDDRSLHNVDFSRFCPMFTLKEINHLEKKFLELICTSRAFWTALPGFVDVLWVL